MKRIFTFLCALAIVMAGSAIALATEDFVRNGRRYYLLDMTRKDEVGVDIQTHTETITQASDTNNLETILQRLDAELEVTTEDSYAGTTASRYATGYTVSANYTGEVSMADCAVVTYTAIFGSEKTTEGATSASVSEETDGKETVQPARMLRRSLWICPASSGR